MNFKQAEAALIGYFAQHWGNTTPIAWPNLNFTPPNGAWVRFSIKNNIGQQASMGSPGSNKFRRRGIAYVQVFVKEGGSIVNALTKADAAANIFLTERLAGFIFSNVNVKDTGPDGNGWYQYLVSAEYQYDTHL